MASADVFVDTAGFLALWDAGDDHHAVALELQKELVRKKRRFFRGIATRYGRSRIA